MFLKLNVKFLLFFSSIIVFSKEAPVELTAKTGIINKEIDKEQFSFIIKVDVSQNITNNISKVFFKLNIGKVQGTFDITSICNVKPVRVAQGGAAETDLMCSFDTTGHPNINTETDLFVDTSYASNPPDLVEPGDISFSLINFEKISNPIVIEDQKLIYTKDDNECVNNHYIFEIVNKLDITQPLQSTICNIALSEDEDHKEARCVIPYSGKTMKCSVDMSKKKYIKGSKIIIKQQDLIQCENGQNIKISSDSENELTINEECDYSKFINFNYLCLLLTFILL